MYKSINVQTYKYTREKDKMRYDLVISHLIWRRLRKTFKKSAHDNAYYGQVGKENKL